MAGAQGWYIGRIQTASVASAKAGGSTSVSDTVFNWTGTARPTVATADITGLTAIVGGPYATQAAALAAAGADANVTTATAGEGTSPGVSTSTAGSSGGLLPSWTSGLTALLADLTSGSLWLRIAEGALGIVLIAVGLARLTHAVPIATKIAGAVA